MEKYHVLGILGEGSYGTVLKCRHKISGKLVAIKRFIDADEDDNTEIKKIAVREVTFLKQLHHPHLVKLFEVFRRHRKLYLVFEFLHHSLLDELDTHSKGLSNSCVRKYFWQILKAVEFCHQNQIIHRDIKPENILVSKKKIVKLCDFGFARKIPNKGEPCTDYVATRWYRAPELLVGETIYGKEVDIWALGCLYYEMIRGKPLFPGKTDLDQLFKIIECLGDLPDHLLRLFELHPSLKNNTLPKAKKSASLEKKLKHHTKNILHFSKCCLNLEPDKRSTICQLLRHPYFKREDFVKEYLPKLKSIIENVEPFTSVFLLHGCKKHKGCLQNEIVSETSSTKKQNGFENKRKEIKCLNNTKTPSTDIHCNSVAYKKKTLLPKMISNVKSNDKENQSLGSQKCQFVNKMKTLQAILPSSLHQSFVESPQLSNSDRSKGSSNPKWKTCLAPPAGHHSVTMPQFGPSIEKSNLHRKKANKQQPAGISKDIKDLNSNNLKKYNRRPFFVKGIPCCCSHQVNDV